MSTPDQAGLRKKVIAFLMEESKPGDVGREKVLEELAAHPDMLVLDAILPCWMTSRETMGLLQWLIENGCNPLDPAQATLSQHAHIERGTISLAFVLRRLEDEEGKALRSPDGENLVHLLCQARPEWLGTSLVDYVDNARHDSGRYLPKWFNEARLSDGNTPLHIWWKGTEKVLMDEVEEKNTPFFEWDVSEALIRAGADVEARDSEGVSCARCMLNAAQIGTPMPMYAPGVIKALSVIEHEDLQEQTAPASKSGLSRRI